MRYPLSIRAVRTAIRKHQLSFPSQVPTFIRLYPSDIQWRMVILYFVRGWSCMKIGQRYGISKRRVGQLIRKWSLAAADLGYLSQIPAECQIPAE